jgi:hypothetical protein
MGAKIHAHAHGHAHHHIHHCGAIEGSHGASPFVKILLIALDYIRAGYLCQPTL